MAHTGTQVWGQFDEDVRPYKGIPGALISEDTHRPKDADFAGGYFASIYWRYACYLCIPISPWPWFVGQ